MGADPAVDSGIATSGWVFFMSMLGSGLDGGSGTGGIRAVSFLSSDTMPIWAISLAVSEKPSAGFDNTGSDSRSGGSGDTAGMIGGGGDGGRSGN